MIQCVTTFVCDIESNVWHIASAKWILGLLLTIGLVAMEIYDPTLLCGFKSVGKAYKLYVLDTEQKFLASPVFHENYSDNWYSIHGKICVLVC